MWKDACFGEVIWFLFEHSITPGKNRTPCLTNRALMFNSEAMISTGCWSRSGGKTRQTCREWRFERRSAGGWCHMVPCSPRCFVARFCRHRPVGGILPFVLLKKIQLYRIPSTLITKHPVLLSSKSQTIWFCLKTGHPKIWWFINVYHGSSMCIMVYQQVSIFKRLFEGNPILREIHLTSSNNWGALPKTFVGSWFRGLYRYTTQYIGD